MKSGRSASALSKPAQAFVITAEPEQSVAHIVADDGIGRVESVRALIVGQRFLISFQGAQHPRAHLERRGVVRPQRAAQVELRKRLLEPFELMQENAALIGRLPMAGVELQGALKGSREPRRADRAPRARRQNASIARRRQA